jgi:trehalose 6-phosphate phosphatase
MIGYRSHPWIFDRISPGEDRLMVAAAFDGALTRFTRWPEDSYVPPPTLEVLRELMESGRVTVAIFSGRRVDDLASKLRLPAILAGNDGLEIRGEGVEFTHPTAMHLRPELAAACRDLAAVVTQWPGAWIEDKGLTAAVHYRSVDVADQHQVVLAVRRTMAPYAGALGMRAGAKSMEIRPRTGWDRGSALTYIKVKTGIAGPCIAIGSDRADEALFRANKGELNVRVGEGPSQAGVFVADALEAGRFLSSLLDGLSSREAGGGGQLLRAACV